MNSLTAHNFEKVNPFEACDKVNGFNIICLSESFVDSLILAKKK